MITVGYKIELLLDSCSHRGLHQVWVNLKMGKYKLGRIDSQIVKILKLKDKQLRWEITCKWHGRKLSNVLLPCDGNDKRKTNLLI